MAARLTAALLAGRAAAALSRRLGCGGGTVISGHVVSRIAPYALRDIAARLPRGCVLISGTNGKTTTSRMLSHILAGQGLRTVHNRAGANLLSGLVSAVVSHASLDGSPRAEVGVFEVDEATLPAAIREVPARAIVLVNLFRDQLDRYGEVAYVASLWRGAIAATSPATRLVLNADDPQVAALGRGRDAAMYFGLQDRAHGQPRVPHAADVRLCPCCGSTLAYAWVYYGHLGDYRCPACGFARPRADVAAIACRALGVAGAELELRTPIGRLQLALPLPGLYNVYNALAAAATALALDTPPTTIATRLATFRPAFGRLERASIDGRALVVALIKNPVGANEVLKTILAEARAPLLVIAINDRFADGTDVSWLWDVDFELLAGRLQLAIVAGLRAEDMAVRLKYAQVETDRVLVEREPRRALEVALERSRPGETIYVLPTYTAMLEAREALRSMGGVADFWED